MTPATRWRRECGTLYSRLAAEHRRQWRGKQEVWRDVPHSSGSLSELECVETLLRRQRPRVNRQVRRQPGRGKQQVRPGVYLLSDEWEPTQEYCGAEDQVLLATADNHPAIYHMLALQNDGRQAATIVASRDELIPLRRHGVRHLSQWLNRERRRLLQDREGGRLPAFNHVLNFYYLHMEWLRRPVDVTYFSCERQMVVFRLGCRRVVRLVTVVNS